jgi:hypothetical protein
VTSVSSVARGGGSRIGLMKPKRTTKSQTMNSSSGPTKGSSAPQRLCGAAAGAGGGRRPGHRVGRRGHGSALVQQASTTTFFSKMPFSVNRS